MTKRMFDDVPMELRAQMLHDNCRETIEQKVKRQFTSEEMESMRVELTDDSIKVSELRDNLKALTAPLKSEIKDLDLVIHERLKKLKNKYEENMEQVYFFDNQEENVMETYDVTGELIATRKLLPSEKQGKLFNINQQKQG